MWRHKNDSSSSKTPFSILKVTKITYKKDLTLWLADKDPRWYITLDITLWRHHDVIVTSSVWVIYREHLSSFVSKMTRLNKKEKWAVFAYFWFCLESIYYTFDKDQASDWSIGAAEDKVQLVKVCFVLKRGRTVKVRCVGVQTTNCVYSNRILRFNSESGDLLKYFRIQIKIIVIWSNTGIVTARPIRSRVCVRWPTMILFIQWRVIDWPAVFWNTWWWPGRIWLK